MPAISIARFTDEIIAVYAARDRAPSTVRQVRQVLRELAECGVRRTSDLTTASIAAWRSAHPGRGPETTRSHLRCLSALCTYAAFQGYVKRDPFDLYGVNDWVRDDAKPKRPARQYHRAAADIRRVLALASEEAAGGGWEPARLEAYVHTLFLTGGRPGEIQHVLAANLDCLGRTITIEPVEVIKRGGRRTWWRPKTVGSSATLPIGDGLVAILERWQRRCGSAWLFPGKKLAGPWTCGGPGVRPLDQVRALGERAGVRDLVNKSARKSLGTHAKAIGLAGLERKALFRHEDERTGERYDEEAVESLRPAVMKIERYYLGTGT